jgi:hypothetical protein
MTPTAQLQQTEAEFQSAVIDLARLRGWRVAHFHDSRRQVGGRLVGDADAEGYLDLTLTRRGVLVFAELKSESGCISKGQCAWINDLTEVAEHNRDVHVRLWRPSDWNEIEGMLR